MTSDREIAVFMANIYYEIDQTEEFINCIKEVIRINPILSKKERNLFSNGYRKALKPLFIAIRIIDFEIKNNDNINPLYLKYLKNYKSQLLNKLENLVKESVGLIDFNILPLISDNESIIFYEKMKASMYCYLVYSIPKEESTEYICKCKQSFEKSFDIAKINLSPKNDLYLHLIHKYTIFLYEKLEHKNEAIDLGSKAVKECFAAMNEEDEEIGCIQNDLTVLMIDDNVKIWKKEMTNSNEE
ncbi:hypothetical protein M9Y10_010692 [Tritrichomonas musculus]|uniref:14-3-3 domain-containing protein n=1 Tax=Tritrichomonas musculus TaxID=1915356 RepID=A0ABR2ILK6_9EUKA